MRHKVRLRKGTYWTLQVTLNFIVCLLKTVESRVCGDDVFCLMVSYLLVKGMVGSN